MKSRRKIKTGTVTSDKMDKTVTVVIERRFAHPLYKKQIKKTNKFMAHDENNDCHIGDVIRIIESRPLSAKKRWRVLDVVERAK